MRALVIGGAGFIGSHLCDALVDADETVVCVDNFSMGMKDNIAHLEKNNKFILYEIDAACMDTLETVFKAERPDYVFHLAANSDIRESALKPEIEFKNTYTTTFQILSCMRKYGVQKIFFASTSAVYGDKKGIVLDENTPGLMPISYYGAAKMGSEALISAFAYMNDMKALIFRFPNVIGPRLTHGVIYDFIKKLKNDSSCLQILGDGRQTKPYMYVSDLIEAIMQLKNATKEGVTLYNIGTEGSSSVTTIANIVCEEMGLSSVKYRYTGGNGGWKGDVPMFRYSTEKILATGWRAKYTSDEAVRKTVRDNISV